MRAFIFILIPCFFLSSVANAAMLCCMGEIPANDNAKMAPCHEHAQAEASIQHDADSAEIEHQCHCDICFQQSITQKIEFGSLFMPNDFEAAFVPELTARHVDLIYLPPKQSV